MITLKDPILTAPPSPNGIELPPLREPESLEISPSFIPPAVATVMTSRDLEDAAGS